jgi:hypothetical protein
MIRQPLTFIHIETTYRRVTRSYVTLPDPARTVEPDYRPESWALLRSYRVGPVEHPWSHWLGALLMLALTFGVLLNGVYRWI